MGESGLFQKEYGEENEELENLREWRLARELLEEGRLALQRERELDEAAKLAIKEGDVRLYLSAEEKMDNAEKLVENGRVEKYWRVITDAAVKEHYGPGVYEKIREQLENTPRYPAEYDERERKLVLAATPFFEALEKRKAILDAVKHEYSDAA